jgi:hypothetical protein
MLWLSHRVALLPSFEITIVNGFGNVGKRAVSKQGDIYAICVLVK